METGETVCCFYRLEGGQQDAPRIPKRGKYLQHWCIAKGNKPRVGEDMSAAIFIGKSFMVTVSESESGGYSLVSGLGSIEEGKEPSTEAGKHSITEAAKQPSVEAINHSSIEAVKQKATKQSTDEAVKQDATKEAITQATKEASTQAIKTSPAQVAVESATARRYQL